MGSVSVNSAVDRGTRSGVVEESLMTVAAGVGGERRGGRGGGTHLGVIRNLRVVRCRKDAFSMFSPQKLHRQLHRKLQHSKGVFNAHFVARASQSDCFLEILPAALLSRGLFLRTFRIGKRSRRRLKLSAFARRVNAVRSSSRFIAVVDAVSVRRVHHRYGQAYASPLKGRRA